MCFLVLQTTLMHAQLPLLRLLLRPAQDLAILLALLKLHAALLEVHLSLPGQFRLSALLFVFQEPLIKLGLLLSYCSKHQASHMPDNVCQKDP